MTLEEARAVKDTVLGSKVDDSVIKSLPASVHGIVETPVARRRRTALGAGLARLDDDDFRVVLRIPQDQPAAANLASSFVSSFEDQIVSAEYGTPNLADAYASNPTRSNTVAFGSKLDPPSIGCSISLRASSAPTGSIGAFVTANIRGETTPCLLSCAHILTRFLAVDKTSSRDERKIYHPSKKDKGGALTDEDSIGLLTNYVTVDPEDANVSDAAIARLFPSAFGADDEEDLLTLLSNNLPDATCGKFSGQPVFFDDTGYPGLGETVYKLGRTTGLTEGVVNAVSLDSMQIAWKSRSRPKKYLFNNMVEVKWSEDKTKPFSNPGDSGAMVFRKGDDGKLYGIALVVAGAYVKTVGPVTYCATLKDIKDDLNLEFI